MAKIHFRPYTTKQILLFPQRIDENIAEDDPVRLVNSLIDMLDLTSFRKLYKEYGLPRLKKTEVKKIKQLYETAFPEDEQIPWEDLMRLVGEMPLDFTAYYDGEAFIGFTIVYPRKSFNWFWYFAVNEELRGKGYGQQILTQLIE